jgi:sarcosine oxidase
MSVVMASAVSGSRPEPHDVDLVVIGGGVMGLFTAYEAAAHGQRVAVLERGRVGDPQTASFGRTRSFRRDYLDPVYARLAHEAIGLWGEFEQRTGSEVLVRCGCMNVATSAVTPDLPATYAARSTEVLRGLGMDVDSSGPARIADRFPYLRADLADLDDAGGLVNLSAVTAALLAALPGAVIEHTTVTAITPAAEPDDRVRVQTDAGEFTARSLVITAGHGTNDVLALLPGRPLQVPITRDRPSEARYISPPPDQRHLFTAAAMPVIAYLDTGIYLHPIVPGLVEDVKIGYYNPPDVPRGTTSIAGIDDFLEQCMPGLAGHPSRPVDDADGCDYDLVADDDFVLGAVPGSPRVFVGVGWRGTGYKFAPWVGRVLDRLARGQASGYELSRFDPARFAPVPEGISR